MATETTTTPDDVQRYIETDHPDEEITEYIDDAEDEALTYNEVEDFHPGELDRLVTFYTALLIARTGDSSGGDATQLRQGSRTVTLTTPGADGRAWLTRRVRANDPSGDVLAGRRGTRHITFSGSGGGGS